MCCSASTGNKIFAIFALIVAVTLVSKSGQVCKQWSDYKENVFVNTGMQVVAAIDKLLDTNVAKEGERAVDLMIGYSAVATASGVLQVLAAFLALIAAFEGKKNRVGACCAGLIFAVGCIMVIAVLGLSGVQDMTKDQMDLMGDSFKSWVAVMIVDVVYLVIGSVLIACLSRSGEE